MSDFKPTMRMDDLCWCMLLCVVLWTFDAWPVSAKCVLCAALVGFGVLLSLEVSSRGKNNWWKVFAFRSLSSGCTEVLPMRCKQKKKQSQLVGSNTMQQATMAVFSPTVQLGSSFPGWFAPSHPKMLRFVRRRPKEQFVHLWRTLQQKSHTFR